MTWARAWTHCSWLRLSLTSCGSSSYGTSTYGISEAPLLFLWLGHPHHKDRARRVPQHVVGDAAEERPPQTTAAVRRHRDQVGLQVERAGDDRVGGLPLRLVDLDRSAVGAQALGDPTQVGGGVPLLGLGQLV